MFDSDVCLNILKLAHSKGGLVSIQCIYDELDFRNNEEVWDKVRVEIAQGALLLHNRTSDSISTEALLCKTNKGTLELWLSTKDRFLLMQHQQYESAISDSKQSRKHAIIAIALSVLTGITSICFSVFSLNSTTKLEVLNWPPTELHANPQSSQTNTFDKVQISNDLAETKTNNADYDNKLYEHWTEICNNC